MTAPVEGLSSPRSTDHASSSSGSWLETAGILAKELLLVAGVGVALFLVLQITGLLGRLDGLGDVRPRTDLALEMLGLLAPFLIGLVLVRTVQARRALDDQARRAIEAAMDRARLETLVADSPAVIYSAAPGGDFETRYISPNIARILGHAPEAVLADPGFWLDHVHPDDRERVLAGFEAMDDGVLHQTYRYEHADGSYRWVEDGIHVVHDARGEPIELVGHMLDVTSQHAAEAELRVSEARFRAIADNLGDLLWVARPDGSIDYLSPAFESLYGVPPETLESDPSAFLGQIHPEDRAIFARLLAGEDDGFDPSASLEHRVIGPGGQVRSLESRMTEVLDEDGEVRWIVGITTDITHRKESQALREATIEREAAIEHLEAAAEFRTRFLNRAAHELATPLTPARFHLGTLAALDLEDGSAAEAIEGISRNVDRLSRAVKLLVLAARLEGGQVVLSQETVAFSELAETCAQQAQDAYRGTDRSLASTLEAGLVVTGDEDRLALALESLLEEGRQLLPAGGTAHLDARGSDGRVRVVLDVDAVDPERAHGTGASPGVEVDLRVFVARGLVEAHGGRLTVEPHADGQGQRFVLELPGPSPASSPPPVDPARGEAV